MASQPALPSTRPSPSRTRRLLGIAGTLALGAGLAVALTPPVHASTLESSSSEPTLSAPSESSTSVTAVEGASCSTSDAASGAAAGQLCWLDLSAYSAASATAPSAQHLSVSVAGGYVLSFDLEVSGGAVSPTALGAWPAAYLGTDGVLTGVAGSPALSQTGSATTTEVTLSSLRLVDAAGHAVADFTLVGADAESTDRDESIVWTSDVDLASAAQFPLGDACEGQLTGFGSSTVTCLGGGDIEEHRTGVALVAAENPQTFGETMVGGGEEGVAFAVVLPSIGTATTAAAETSTSGSGSAAGTAANAGSGTAGNAASVTAFSDSGMWGATSLATAALLLFAAAVTVVILRRRRSLREGHSLR